MTELDVAIVGGGLAGLAAATRLAQGGARCALFERSETLGGRARTAHKDGFSLNLGPHALYRNNAAIACLRSLGVPIPGSKVSGSNLYALDGDRLRPLPGGFVSLVTTDLLDVRGKLEFARFLTGVRRLVPASLAGRSAADWLEGIHDERARSVIGALVRTATYSAAHDRISAEVASDQLKTAVLEGVLYVDGGWSTLVDGLTKVATESGVTISRGTRVDGLTIESQRVTGIVVGDRTIAAEAVLLAGGGPSWAAELSGSPVLRDYAATAVPIRGATLDVALDTRIEPRLKFACALDRPLYFSVHSDTARVAPNGGSLVSTMLYLHPDDPRDARAHEAELHGWLDQLQRGWRDHVVTQQFLPEMTVAHAQVPPGLGLRGRPSVAVPEVDGLYVAGDWVGATGFLADAALASAQAAADAIAKRRLDGRDRSRSERSSRSPRAA